MLHRVLEVNEGKVILKGDGNYRGQEICPLEKVAGKVKEVQHMDGSITIRSLLGRCVAGRGGWAFRQ